MKKALRKATEAWVAQFIHVPASVIKKMAKADEFIYAYDSDSLRLIASPRIKCSWCSATYEGALSLAELTAASDRGKGVPCDYCRSDDSWTLGEPQYAFPCGWGTLFAPVDPSDLRWLDEHKDEVARLGFFVFQSEDYSILLGLDAGGFGFYEAYWMPLYQLRGLRWHEAGREQ
jgi:hypothetical protein